MTAVVTQACGEPVTFTEKFAVEPCPKPSGHDGEHIFWRQFREPRRKRDDGYPLCVFTDAGVLLHWFHFESVAVPADIEPLIEASKRRLAEALA